jgi:hypothetical protein
VDLGHAKALKKLTGFLMLIGSSQKGNQIRGLQSGSGLFQSGPLKKQSGF